MLVLFLALIAGMSGLVSAETSLIPGVQVTFCSAEAARTVLGRTDSFVERLGPFDRQARLKTGNDVSEAAYLRFVEAQAMEWSEDETRLVSQAFASFRERLATLNLNLNLPNTIQLIKTTGREEGAAAYTRGAAIVLPQNKLKGDLAGLMAHELFHVLSRHNPDLHDALYGLLGFRRCGEISLPTDLAIRRITNPDAPRNQHYLTVGVGEQKVHVVPILYSNTAYDPERGGSFFDYLQFRLMAVGELDGQWKRIDRDGKPWLLSPSEVSDLKEQVGRSGTFLHPEEVMAERFVELGTGTGELSAASEALRNVLRRE